MELNKESLSNIILNAKKNIKDLFATIYVFVLPVISWVPIVSQHFVSISTKFYVPF